MALALGYMALDTQNLLAIRHCTVIASLMWQEDPVWRHLSLSVTGNVKEPEDSHLGHLSWDSQRGPEASP